MALDSESSLLAHAAQNAALIALSLAFLPFDTFILVASYVVRIVRSAREDRYRRAVRSPYTPLFFPKTVLVTGVGMAKGLCLARLFYVAGHNVIGADFEPAFLPIACGRMSKSINKFYKLSKPIGPDGGAKYTQSILEIVRKEKVDLWVSCSGVASAIEDGSAKEMIELLTSCKAVQFDVPTTRKLHEKHTFIEYTKSIGLPTPDTHTITSKAAALKLLDDASDNGKHYILKYIGTDDAVRGDMTLLPLTTPSATKAHVSRLPISEERPWILQQFISGPEFCTHSLVVKGEVKAFVACPSSELLMHYQALPSDSGLSQAMLRFTQEYASAGGPTFTGHLSFDFLVDADEADAAMHDPAAPVVLHPIECNPRAHTANILFNDTPRLAEAYMTLLDSGEPECERPPPPKTTIPNGSAPQPIFPQSPAKYFWIGHDLVESALLSILSLLTLSGSSVVDVFDGLLTFVEHCLWWRDGTYESWDPLPAWWLYHVYWPTQWVMALLWKKKWSRLNVSTTKMFMC